MRRVPVGRLVFLDESGCNIAMARTSGWGPKGERIVDYKPANWGTNISVVGAIRSDGVVCHRMFDGAINTEKFLLFVRETLCPRLRPGDIVVLDNLRPHRDPAVFEALREVGARGKLLPPYSPDLNPIELLWSRVKSSVRAVASRTRTGVVQTVRNALRRVPTEHFVNWFGHCGYRAQRMRSSV